MFPVVSTVCACGQLFELGPRGVGRGGDVVVREAGTRQPALVAGFADATVDGHRLRREQVAQGTDQRDIENITVADIMDREPVTIPAELTLLDAHDRFFAQHQWPWFAVVDPSRHFLGVLREQRVESEIAAGRPALPVTDALEDDMPVRIDEEAPLESLLGSEGLGRLGAMVAVDSEGVLQGVVTLAQIRRALNPAT